MPSPVPNQTAAALPVIPAFRCGRSAGEIWSYLVSCLYGDIEQMARLLLFICVAYIIGCSQSDDSVATITGTQEVATKTIKHGRVTLTSHKIEAGAPNETAIQSGLDTATSVLNGLLETEELKPATGLFVGRFRLESDGTVRMFLTDKSTSITGADGDKLEGAFVGAAFGGKCSFPKLGDVAMLYVEFKIDPPQ